MMRNKLCTIIINIWSTCYHTNIWQLENWLPRFQINKPCKPRLYKKNLRFAIPTCPGYGRTYATLNQNRALTICCKFTHVSVCHRQRAQFFVSARAVLFTLLTLLLHAVIITALGNVVPCMYIYIYIYILNFIGVINRQIQKHIYWQYVIINITVFCLPRATRQAKYYIYKLKFHIY